MIIILFCLCVIANSVWFTPLKIKMYSTSDILENEAPIDTISSMNCHLKCLRNNLLFKKFTLKKFMTDDILDIHSNITTEDDNSNYPVEIICEIDEEESASTSASYSFDVKKDIYLFIDM